MVSNAKAFRALGQGLAPRRIAVYAYDQRGFGAGVNVGLWAGTLTMTADLRAAAAHLRDDHPGVPHILGVDGRRGVLRPGGGPLVPTG